MSGTNKPRRIFDWRRVGWRLFVITLFSQAVAMLAMPFIRDGLGWPDRTLVSIAIAAPVAVLIMMALQRIFPARG